LLSSATPDIVSYVSSVILSQRHPKSKSNVHDFHP